MWKAIRTNRFEKNLALCMRRGCDMELFKEVARLLSEGKPLPKKYKAHKLEGNLSDFWDCHIKADWVLIFRLDYINGQIIFENIGTHSDLF